MKLSLATLTALLVALAHAAPVPGDSTEISGNALVEANVLNDAVKNVGNNAASGLLKEVDGLVKQLTEALGGLVPLRKRGDETEITDNALIKADVLNDAVKNVGNDAASGLLEELSGLLGQLTGALGGLLKRDSTEITDNALVDAKVANNAAKNILNNAAKRHDDIDLPLDLNDLLKRDNTEISDNAGVDAKVANDAAKNILNDALKRGDDTEIKDNTLIKLNILNDALKNILNALASS